MEITTSRAGCHYVSQLRAHLLSDLDRLRWNDLLECIIKLRPHFLHAELSSGFYEPLELRLVIRLAPRRALGFRVAWAFWLAHTYVFPQSGVR